jgi:hypothetical protein
VLDPALLTSRSRPPNSETTAPTSSWVCATSLISAGKADAAPVVAELADERIGAGLVGSIVDRDCGSLGGEPPHDRGADSAAASGDQDPLARQA